MPRQKDEPTKAEYKGPTHRTRALEVNAMRITLPQGATTRLHVFSGGSVEASDGAWLLTWPDGTLDLCYTDERFHQMFEVVDGKN